MKKEVPRFKITKLDAAKRQIETAITLYFLGKDAVSIHTLTGAAYQILKDLNKKRDGNSMLMDEATQSIYVKPGHLREVFKKLYEAENFFKHADRDPDETIDFSPKSSELLLFEAALKYAELSGEHTPTIRAYSSWIQLSYPDLFNYPEGLSQRVSSAGEGLDSISKQSFYTEFIKLDVAF